MKKLIGVLGLLMFLPIVAQAAWWNPITWFSRNTVDESDIKIKLLEDKISVLQNDLTDLNTKYADIKSKVSEVSTTTLTSTSTPTTTPKVIKTSVKNKVPPVVTPKPAVTFVSTSTSVIAKDYNSLYKTVLIPKYVSFKNDVIDKEISDMQRGGTNDVQKIHLDYLKKTSNTLNEDIAQLTKLDPNQYDFYFTKFDDIKKVYNAETNLYLRMSTINYISENKYELYIPSIHVKAANVLDLYDRTFGTSYAYKFRMTTTQIETVEFANSFFIDLGFPNLAN